MREGERCCFWKWSTVSQWREVGLALIFDLSILSFLSLLFSPCFWRDQFCFSVCLCWSVSWPWPLLQSQPLVPIETNPRSRLPVLWQSNTDRHLYKKQMFQGRYFSCHYRFNHTIKFFFNRWYLSCCSNSAYFFIMSSFSQVSLLKASTSPAATLLHLHWY